MSQLLRLLMLIVLAALLVVSGSDPAHQANSALPETVTIGGMDVHGLHCRQGPTTSSPLIRILFDGEVVPVRGPEVGGWLPVVCAGEDGWIMAEYVPEAQELHGAE